ncbi:MAG: hypothetical protein K2O14_12130, partial [Oscillospiraceae bacterium]|nr:hypothetical protein [Oscillospiraceae bacterium]
LRQIKRGSRRLHLQIFRHLISLSKKIFRDPPATAHSASLRCAASGSREKFPARAECCSLLAFL